MITGIWINGDRIAVQSDEESITVIDTRYTYPDGVSFECQQTETLDGEWVQLYPEVDFS